ncbi:MAG: helix-turn-helix domain-containing protein [Anaeroplasmataceae bacterium]|nr:helix-turn-helix domain-containing protein [Anaeroplasmataceae bacterium]
MQFSEKLKKLRQENNLTQAELADKLYVTRQAVTKWENGRGMPETNIALEIAKIFNVSLDYLMDDAQEEFKTDIPSEYKAKKKTKKMKPLIKAIILGASLICIVGCVLIGMLIHFKIEEDKFEKQEYIIGIYLTMNEVTFYDEKEVLDAGVPYYFLLDNFVIDKNLPRGENYFNGPDRSIYIPLRNHVYLYEISYVPKTKRYYTNLVGEISKSNRYPTDIQYTYTSKEQKYFGHTLQFDCNIYLLDAVESLNITALNKNSQVIYDVTYHLNENGKIETNKGEILEYLPTSVTLNDAVQCYVEYQSGNGRIVKKLFTLGDDITSTRCIIFMQREKEFLARDYLVCFYFH